MESKTRHVLSISGGKDSTALAIYMRDRVPDMEYVFMDTGEELPETYEYLDRLEALLGISVVRLNPERPFQHYLDVYRGVLPDARTRWCTRMLKIRPFERYVGDSNIVSYVAIRYDERSRKGYISNKSNILTVYPFVEDMVDLSGVNRILHESGIGLPEYYNWRSRSGCYFCFFQRVGEWIGLLSNHPDLYDKAQSFEKIGVDVSDRFTWNSTRSLGEIRDAKFIEKHSLGNGRAVPGKKRVQDASLIGIFSGEDVDENSPCTVCAL